MQAYQRFFETANAYLLVQPISYLKTLLFLFGDQLYESDDYDDFCHENSGFSDALLLMLFFNLKNYFRQSTLFHQILPNAILFFWSKSYILVQLKSILLKKVLSIPA